MKIMVLLGDDEEEATITIKSFKALCYELMIMNDG